MIEDSGAGWLVLLEALCPPVDDAALVVCGEKVGVGVGGMGGEDLSFVDPGGGGADLEFAEVGDAVVVGIEVGVGGVEGQEAPGDFPAVVHAVAVGVGVVGVGAVAEFFEVGELVAVGIGVEWMGGVGVEAVFVFPFVGQPVAIGVFGLGEDEGGAGVVFPGGGEEAAVFVDGGDRDEGVAGGGGQGLVERVALSATPEGGDFSG